jgi:hypothetical protein
MQKKTQSGSSNSLIRCCNCKNSNISEKIVLTSWLDMKPVCYDQVCKDMSTGHAHRPWHNSLCQSATAPKEECPEGLYGCTRICLMIVNRLRLFANLLSLLLMETFKRKEQGNGVLVIWRTPNWSDMNAQVAWTCSTHLIWSFRYKCVMGMNNCWTIYLNLKNQNQKSRS